MYHVHTTKKSDMFVTVIYHTMSPIVLYMSFVHLKKTFTQSIKNGT